MARMVTCVKLGREAEGLDFPPYPGELGKRIFENVSKEAWKQWLEHQKMLVNENRLNLADGKTFSLPCEFLRAIRRRPKCADTVRARKYRRSARKTSRSPVSSPSAPTPCSFIFRMGTTPAS